MVLQNAQNQLKMLFRTNELYDDRTLGPIDLNLSKCEKVAKNPLQTSFTTDLHNFTESPPQVLKQLLQP